MHVVVVSGYNVTVVGGVLVALLVQFVSRRWVIPMAFLGIAAYAAMAGADPPVIRTAIMGLLSLTAQFFGRLYQGFWVLVLSALIMALVSPLVVFDVGFQLSFAAMLGIIAVTPVLTSYLRMALGCLGRGIVEEFAVTLGAQLMVLPILLMHFGRVSWMSSVVNLVVAFVVPITIGFGGLLAILSFLWMGLAQVFALFAWVPLTFFVGVVSWFSKLPFGSFYVSSLSWWWVVGYYAVLAWLIWWFSRRCQGNVLASRARGGQKDAF
jgi:competence protein ComEC